MSQSIERSPMPPGEAELGWGVLAWVQNQAIPFQVEDGWAVAEGDMRLGRIEDAEVVRSASGTTIAIFGGRIEGDAIVATDDRLWPGAIPFTSEEVIAEKVDDAVREWNRRLGGFLELHPHGGEPHYLHFVGVGAADGNWSEIGCLKKPAQEVWIEFDAEPRVVLHEICHAAGLLHEHNRHDRGSFIALVGSHIPADRLMKDWALRANPGTALPPYDLDSLTHYRPDDHYQMGSPIFNLTPGGLAHYRSIHGSGAVPRFDAETLSDGDVVALRALYGLP